MRRAERNTDVRMGYALVDLIAACDQLSVVFMFPGSSSRAAARRGP